MTGLRTLPIRLEPLDGEALDSWFEALAFRMHMPAGALLASLGLMRYTDRSRQDRPQTNWMVMLRPLEAEAIASVTGIDAMRLVSMTLAAYHGRALLINPQSHEVNRWLLWGRNVGSRYCPHCLADTNGRWSLSWRLGWSFACLRHRCLLADTCQRCDRIQRIYRFRGERLMHPAQCAYPAPGSGASIRCGTDLRDAACVQFDDDHPVLHAQRLVCGTIGAGRAAFGLYADQPVAASRALADVKAIATRALAQDSAHALAEHMPGDLLPVYTQSMARLQAAAGSRNASVAPGRMSPPRAVIAATGVIAATDVLGKPTVQQAAAALRWLTVDARTRGRVINPSTAGHWGRGTSPMLLGVTLASLEPALRPSHKLRYRVSEAHPGLTDNALTRFESLARSTPSLLWPSWTVRLAPPGVSARIARAALSAFLLLPGTQASLKEAAEKLGGASNALDASRILQIIEDTTGCSQILTALTRLSDHLADHPAPIDYQRRRALDYANLLPDHEWNQICGATGVVTGTRKAGLARAYLAQRLSTLPQDYPPAALAYPRPQAFRWNLAEFTIRLFPGLAAALDAAGRGFLARYGITCEPAAWQPPLTLAADLELPGPDLASVDTRELHQLIHQRNSPSKTARAIGVTADAVRLILAEHPAPARRIQRGQGSLAGPRTRSARISKPELEQLYPQERLPIRTIAARCKVSKPVIADLLRHYEIPVGCRPPPGVTPAWLRQEYLGNGRSFRDLAQEAGTSAGVLTRWARRYGLPIRPRGGPRDRRKPQH